MLSLRNYQQDIVDRIRDAYRKGFRSPLFVLPTGAGKSPIFNYIASSIATKGFTAAIVVHRPSELIPQNAKVLEQQGIPYGVIAQHCSRIETQYS